MRYTYDADTYRREFEAGFTWLSGFLRNVRRAGDAPALIDPAAGRSYTYSDLDRESSRLAHYLAAHGVSQGDVVLFQLPNSPEFALCYLAAQKIGAIASPANYNLSAGETARLLSANDPAAYLYDPAITAMAQTAMEIAGLRPECAAPVDDDFAREVAAFPCVSPAPSGAGAYDEVVRLFTSGTTGKPKVVPVNNINEVLSAHDVIMHFPLSSRDVTMNMTPWFHRGGLHSGGLTPTLYAGGCCVVLRSFSAKTCLEYAERCGVTFLIGVPAVLSSLARQQEKHPADLSRLRGIVTMGSPLDRASCIRFQRVLTPNIFNGYGTTETFWNSFLRPADLPEMAGSAGRACTDDEIRVVVSRDDRRGEPDETVPMDGKTPGEIIIRSLAKSALSYVGDPALTEEKYYKGWFYTHDLGTWDERQFVTIVGRKDDMILSSGENIYPDPIEEILRRHPAVSDAAVVGVPDGARGESVAAYVVTSDASLTPFDLNRFCVSCQDLAAYQRPRYYRIVDAIPYNATGKKQRFLLRQSASGDLETGLLKRP